ncbi:hypothetical protein C5G87_18210 [Paenibacillus peoriae]|uniref:hypothetical protein n=1 Tax=Paenibacillus peoriae TaxID=59893 RepID=UPI000CECB857|nr:hypothetical protein [Paenibacillus peoriae]PPQ47249.1 hypothetical protein C5G87_18210 [Paenibacillus peoriae]
MNFISWIFEHLYILIVIGFALVSFLGKSIQGTGRKSPPRKGMPTFGGDHGSRGPSTSSRPFTTEHGQEQRQQDAAGELQRQFPNERRAVMEARRIEEVGDLSETEGRMDRDSLDNGSTLEDRIRAMEEERRLVLARLDRISNARESREITDAPEIASQDRNTVDTADLRRGVIWAEILGPPRSKRYMGGGRR